MCPCNPIYPIHPMPLYTTTVANTDIKERNEKERQHILLNCCHHF